jgi:RNase H-fold protein (predicted Holliday junction resolvase)
MDALDIRRVTGRRKGKKGPLDDVAAAALLQEYLDAGESDDEPGQPLERYADIA